MADPTREQFDAAVQKVSASAPAGLSRDDFYALIDKEIEAQNIARGKADRATSDASTEAGTGRASGESVVGPWLAGAIKGGGDYFKQIGPNILKGEALSPIPAAKAVYQLGKMGVQAMQDLPAAAKNVVETVKNIPSAIKNAPSAVGSALADSAAWAANHPAEYGQDIGETIGQAAIPEVLGNTATGRGAIRLIGKAGETIGGAKFPLGLASGYHIIEGLKNGDPAEMAGGLTTLVIPSLIGKYGTKMRQWAEQPQEAAWLKTVSAEIDSRPDFATKMSRLDRELATPNLSKERTAALDQIKASMKDQQAVVGATDATGGQPVIRLGPFQNDLTARLKTAIDNVTPSASTSAGLSDVDKAIASAKADSARTRQAAVRTESQTTRVEQQADRDWYQQQQAAEAEPSDAARALPGYRAEAIAAKQAAARQGAAPSTASQALPGYVDELKRTLKTQAQMAADAEEAAQNAEAARQVETAKEGLVPSHTVSETVRANMPGGTKGQVTTKYVPKEAEAGTSTLEAELIRQGVSPDAAARAVQQPQVTRPTSAPTTMDELLRDRMAKLNARPSISIEGLGDTLGVPNPPAPSAPTVSTLPTHASLPKVGQVPVRNGTFGPMVSVSDMPETTSKGVRSATKKFTAIDLTEVGLDPKVKYTELPAAKAQELLLKRRGRAGIKYTLAQLDKKQP